MKARKWSFRGYTQGLFKVEMFDFLKLQTSRSFYESRSLGSEWYGEYYSLNNIRVLYHRLIKTKSF